MSSYLTFVEKTSIRCNHIDTDFIWTFRHCQTRCAFKSEQRSTLGYAKTTNYTLAANAQFSLAVKLNIHHPRLIPYVSRYRWKRKNHVPAYIRPDYISHANHTHSNHKLELKHPPVSAAFSDLLRAYTSLIPWLRTLHICLRLYARDCFFPLDDICYRRNKPWKRGLWVADFFLFLARGRTLHEELSKKEREKRGKIWKVGTRGSSGTRGGIFARKWTRIGALCENEKVTKAEGKDVHIYA